MKLCNENRNLWRVREGELEEGGQKVHTSSLRQISTGDVMYSRVTTANTAVCYGKLLRVNPKISPHKERLFFLFIVSPCGP